MYPLKLDRGQAASRYGKSFVNMMMRESPVIMVSREQDRMALTMKAIRENRITPFDLEWVYVIHDGNGMSKVGRSHTPRSRFNNLSCGSPVPLHFHGALVFGHGGPAVCEKAMHRKLQADGKHRKGEWFEVCPAEAFKMLRGMAPQYNGTADLVATFDTHDKLMPIFEVMAVNDQPRVIRSRRAREEMLWVIERVAENA